MGIVSSIGQAVINMVKPTPTQTQLRSVQSIQPYVSQPQQIQQPVQEVSLEQAKEPIAQQQNAELDRLYKLYEERARGYKEKGDKATTQESRDDYSKMENESAQLANYYQQAKQYATGDYSFSSIQGWVESKAYGAQERFEFQKFEVPKLVEQYKAQGFQPVYDQPENAMNRQLTGFSKTEQVLAPTKTITDVPRTVISAMPSTGISLQSFGSGRFGGGGASTLSNLYNKANIPLTMPSTEIAQKSTRMDLAPKIPESAFKTPSTEAPFFEYVYNPYVKPVISGIRKYRDTVSKPMLPLANAPTTEFEARGKQLPLDTSIISSAPTGLKAIAQKIGGVTKEYYGRLLEETPTYDPLTLGGVAVDVSKSLLIRVPSYTGELLGAGLGYGGEALSGNRKLKEIKISMPSQEIPLRQTVSNQPFFKNQVQIVPQNVPRTTKLEVSVPQSIKEVGFGVGRLVGQSLPFLIYPASALLAGGSLIALNPKATTEERITGGMLAGFGGLQLGVKGVQLAKSKLGLKKPTFEESLARVQQMLNKEAEVRSQALDRRLAGLKGLDLMSARYGLKVPSAYEEAVTTSGWKSITAGTKSITKTQLSSIAEDFVNAGLYKNKAEAIKYIRDYTKREAITTINRPSKIDLRLGSLGDINKRVNLESLKLSPDLSQPRTIRTIGLETSKKVGDVTKGIGIQFIEGSQGRPINKKLISFVGKGQYGKFEIFEAPKGRPTIKNPIFAKKLEEQLVKVKMAGIEKKGALIFREYKPQYRLVYELPKKVNLQELQANLDKFPTKESFNKAFPIGKEIVKDVIIPKETDILLGQLRMSEKTPSSFKELLGKTLIKEKEYTQLAIGIKDYGTMKLKLKTSKAPTIKGEEVKFSNQQAKQIMKTLQDIYQPKVQARPIITSLPQLKPSIIKPTISLDITPKSMPTIVGGLGKVSEFAGKGLYERGAPGLIPGSRLVTLPSQKEKGIISPVYIDRTRDLSKTSDILKSREMTRSIDVLKPTESLRPIESLKPIEELRTQPRIEQIVREQLKQVPRLDTSLRLTPRLIPPTTREPPRITEPPKTPKKIVNTFRLPSKEETKRLGLRKKLSKDLFTVELRRKGAFKPIGIAKDIGQALEIGKASARRTLGASFRIKSAKGYLTLQPTQEFRKSKSYKDPFSLIQVPTARLSSQSERLEIKQSRRFKI